MDFLGESKEFVVPPQFKMKNKPIEAESQWISIKPNEEHPAPSLKMMPNSKVSLYCREEARYAYRDEKGELLFYTLRLIDKKGKKSFLHLSYGIESGENEKPHWAFKAYQTTQKPLYNLQLLEQNPTSKVVIVEGEKTADAANQLLNKHGMICLTWLGGASATAKTDWSSLNGRDVIIWPDNDKPGFKAADSICSELRKSGIKSLRVVDQDALTRLFPPKWDLADPLPEGSKENLVRDLLISANEKCVDIMHLVFAVDKSKSAIELLKIKEILWRVEERLRPELEKTLKDKPQEIRSQLIKETVAIYQQKDQVSKDLKNRLSVDEHQAERLTFQTQLYKAQHGKEISQANILEMKTNLQNSTVLLPKCNVSDQAKEIHALATDTVLSSVFGRKINDKTSNEIKLAFEREVSKSNLQIQQQLALQQMIRQQTVARGVDLSL